MHDDARKPEGAYALPPKGEPLDSCKWVMFVSVGLVPRAQYENLVYAGCSPMMVFGMAQDTMFPSHRIAGPTLDSIKSLLDRQMGELFAAAAKGPPGQDEEDCAHEYRADGGPCIYCGKTGGVLETRDDKPSA